MKGMDLLMAMETLATDGAVREDTRTPEKGDGRATVAPAKPETKANIVKGWVGGWGGVGKTGKKGVEWEEDARG